MSWRSPKAHIEADGWRAVAIITVLIFGAVNTTLLIANWIIAALR